MPTTVFKVKIYDIATDEFRNSKRLATKEGARLMGGEIIGNSAIEIPDEDVESEGWTAKGYDPNRNG